ncbi:MAG: hypothetical protein ACC652_02045, partial [Acidimicrobiales bacterium]
GDASIAQRPMDRIAVPLRQMGATIDGREEGKFPPLAIRGGGLVGITYDMPIASAQVKGAILLAGLNEDGFDFVERESRGWRRAVGEVPRERLIAHAALSPSRWRCHARRCRLSSAVERKLLTDGEAGRGQCHSGASRLQVV